jgi:hypothetical protein
MDRLLDWLIDRSIAWFDGSNRLIDRVLDRLMDSIDRFDGLFDSFDRPIGSSELMESIYR